MSSLAWIDFDEAERQRAQRIMALFQERESRDELGLGSIRDSLADHLFPGTSTIQTRLRYMLFIPWIFRKVESREAAPNQLVAETRALEIRLADALKVGGETYGIIGRDAGPRLRRLPSSVYWAGLGAWGIRLLPGSIDNYFASLQSQRRGRSSQDREDAALGPQVPPIWNPALPMAPRDLLECATFRLTRDEAQFIIDRLMTQQPKALLTRLARDTIDADCTYIWEHPCLADFPPEARHLVRHGEIFSHIMHGAALLYNLQLSELREQDEWVVDYQARLRDWAEALDVFAARDWSLEDFWKTVEHPTHSIRPAAKRFVVQWLALVAEGTTTIEASPAARQLVKEREHRLKTSQSRFTNRAVRDRWTGASGVDRLSFRWPQAKAHLRDLAHVG